ncbi:CAP domain-containing protein [Nocardioides silvaticus]|uniref:CAP domain-containing protein n=1 Tax=Nocardioides silvaticus TaxID=2201891 RepID=A0A316TGU7_9ACTN|nr:CAP domain-containing protein [Nocardioides silvaticus]PWN02429.1 CAP domain-containing protein [Nocardioides silvaticus]
MRKVLAVLTVLAAALVVAPAPAPAAAASNGSDRAARGGGAKARVIALTNARREARGCNPLRSRPALMRAAQKHTNKMRNQGRLDHQLSGEPDLGSRVSREGYRWSMVAENIAYGHASPRAVVRGWMRSEGHRRNILNCRLRHIGIGIATDGAGRKYWTQVFARPL